jgi:hypothetical protein
MKTTFDLPEPLLRRAKAAAAQQGRPLRDLVAEAIDAKLVADATLATAAAPAPDHGWKAFAARLVQQPDGSWINPDGIDDERFFQALEDIRNEGRRSAWRDPFADFEPETAAEPAPPPPSRKQARPAAAPKSSKASTRKPRRG